MGQHEHVRVEGRVVAPRLLGEVEHPPAHDDRAHPLERLVHQVVVGTGSAALETVGLAPAREVVDPLVEPIAAFAQLRLDAVVRSRDEPVQGHRDVHEDLSAHHILLPQAAAAGSVSACSS